MALKSERGKRTLAMDLKNGKNENSLQLLKLKSRVRLPLSDFSAIYWGYFTGQFSLVTILGFFGNCLIGFKVPQYRNVHSGNSEPRSRPNSLKFIMEC